MKIYVYDKESGILIREANAQKNPKKNGEFLFPPNSTIVVPPVLTVYQTAVFNGKNWDVVKNYTGELQIDKVTKEVSEVTELGELPENSMLYSEYIKTDDYKADIKKQKIELKK